jgi:serine/threonine protein phosphatase 1
MRTLVIGDIHGCLTALDALLALVAPTPEDQLIALGDYVDRGPNSRGVLDRMIALFDEGRLVPLRGNHDEMMVNGLLGQDRYLWLSVGGVETLRSYGLEPTENLDREDIPARHWRFLEKDCRDWFETSTHLFVHATVIPDVPLTKQDGYTLRWQKLRGRIRHCSGKTLICGHTRQQSGMPLDLGTTICIDTSVYDSNGWLTCLHVESGRYWQANERGQTRTAWLRGGPREDESE